DGAFYDPMPQFIKTGSDPYTGAQQDCFDAYLTHDCLIADTTGKSYQHNSLSHRQVSMTFFVQLNTVWVAKNSKTPVNLDHKVIQMVLAGPPRDCIGPRYQRCIEPVQDLDQL